MKLTQQLRNALRVLLPGVLALSSLSFAPHAAAQSPQAAPQTAPAAMATRIDGFDVHEEPKKARARFGYNRT